MQLSLEALRVNANMTQQDVADRLGVSRSTVIKWEGES
ncbi:helix-turn-helix transcriptional regulator [Sporosarcina sp. FSL W7-1349]